MDRGVALVTGASRGIDRAGVRHGSPKPALSRRADRPGHDDEVERPASGLRDSGGLRRSPEPRQRVSVTDA